MKRNLNELKDYLVSIGLEVQIVKYDSQFYPEILEVYPINISSCVKLGINLATFFTLNEDFDTNIQVSFVENAVYHQYKYTINLYYTY